MSTAQLVGGFAVLLTVVVGGRLLVVWLADGSSPTRLAVSLAIVAVFVGIPAAYGLRGLLREDDPDGGDEVDRMDAAESHRRLMFGPRCYMGLNYGHPVVGPLEGGECDSAEVVGTTTHRWLVDRTERESGLLAGGSWWRRVWR
jgi:hypothetical protein